MNSVKSRKIIWLIFAASHQFLDAKKIRTLCPSYVLCSKCEAQKQQSQPNNNKIHCADLKQQAPHEKNAENKPDTSEVKTSETVQQTVIINADEINADEKLKFGPSIPRIILIVGCGRSGTEFTSKLLTALGLQVKHERIGLQGTVSWPMVVNSVTPWGPIDSETKFQHIFHQVRNPLHVMTSWFINLPQLDRDEWQFVRNHVPEIDRNDSLIVHCAKYWLYWNLKAEQLAEWRFRVEDLEQSIPELEAHLDIKFTVSSVPTISHKTNSWTSTENKLTWADLKTGLPSDLFEKIQGMAHRYGYVITD